jgi:hypothetical protein
MLGDARSGSPSCAGMTSLELEALFNAVIRVKAGTQGFSHGLLSLRGGRAPRTMTIEISSHVQAMAGALFGRLGLASKKARLTLMSRGTPPGVPFSQNEPEKYLRINKSVKNRA